MSIPSRVAIVGLGGIFPGAPTPEALWLRVARAESVARPVPPGRWRLDPADALSPAGPGPDRVSSPRACLVEEFRFDPEGFALDAGLLSRLDPMFHFVLHAAREAHRDARMDAVDPRRVGVCLAGIALPTDGSSALADEVVGRRLERLVRGRSPADTPGVHPFDRYVSGLPGGLVALALGLGGGARTLDAACASSLYALKLAVDELLAGRADAMLAGGVSRPDSLYTQMGFSQLRALSPTGVCAPFDARANGLVVGEGAGLVVLKRLEDALAHGDRIRAVICGIGLSNDVGGSLMSPDSEGQLRAMRAAFVRAGWRPQDVDLVECHGTGTPVGDATEVASLERLWREARADRTTRGRFADASRRCVIGSVKSNVGHLLTGAGAAGLAKVLGALAHATLPPTANFVRPAPGSPLEGGAFEVLAQPAPWPARAEGVPRRAALSGFGFGGINAHVLLEEWTGAPRDGAAASATPAATTAPAPAAVPLPAPAVTAVVGLGVAVGPWRTRAAFRRRVLGGADDVPPQEGIGGWGLSLPGERGFPIEELHVPAARFRIPPRELEEMLPQQVLLLQVAAAAWDQARADRGDRLRTGVYCGIELDPQTTNYHLRWTLLPEARRWAREHGLELSPAELEAWVADLREAAHPALTANRVMGNLGGLVASRVARAFQVGGPSFTLSSLESSGLSALAAAVRALEQGEIDQALVGAVDFTTDARALRALRALGVDAPASDGAAAVVLKRLDDARRDGDRILALVRGVGAATGEGAALEAMRRAHAEAGIAPEAVGYLETGGGGTAGGEEDDRRAAAALYGPGDRACAWSATVPDLGHAGAATGLLSLAKACLCLEQEILPPSRDAGAGSGRLFRPAAPQYWLRDRADGPRRATVLARGLDGHAVAVLLEGVERPAPTGWEPSPLGPPGEALFAIEADDAESLAHAARELRARAAASEASLHRLAREWRRERGSAPERARALAVVAQDPGELVATLDGALAALAESPERLAAVARAPGARVFFSANPIGRTAPRPQVAFVFPGSGNHYVPMGRELFARWPHVLRRQDAENARLASQFAGGRFWTAPSLDALDPRHRDMIFAQVCLGTLVSDLVRGLGIEPDAVVGHSLGETAGLFSMRAWTDRDGMLRRMMATPLFTTELAGPCEAARRAWGLPVGEPVDWKLGVVDRPAAEVRAALAGRARVHLLIVNTPSECVVGGDASAVAGLVQALGCGFHRLQGVTTVHCDVARQVEQAYRELHLFETRPPRGVRFYSGIAGRAYEPTREACADSILGQALDTLDWTRVVRQAHEDGVRVFLELGPGSSCTRMIGRILEDRPHVARAVCAPGQDGAGSILRLAAHWLAERLPVDPAPLFLDAEPDSDAEAGPTLRLRVGAAAPAMPGLPAPGPAVAEEAPVQAARASRTASPAPPPVAAPRTNPPARTVPAPVPAAIAAGRAPLPGMIAEVAETNRARAEAHGVFLRLSDATAQGLARVLQSQVALVQAAGTPSEREIPAARGTTSLASPATLDPPAAPPPPAWTDPAPPRALDRAACFEFAVGSIGRVLGPRYAPVDAHPTRVRLPDEPLMLVDRILAIEGEPLSLGSGRVVTEHDVLPEGWYLDGGRIPTCIAVESGQADLFLSGFLGIDARTQGLAVYRLLDAVVTFHGELPPPGRTIRYDIHIDRFFRQGETHLFKFRFDGTVDGRPLLTMRDGCAGFFTAAQLAEGKGIVHTALDRRPIPGKRPADWRPLAPFADGPCTDEQVDALRRGDLEAAFGAAFRGRTLAPSLRLPAGRMTLVHRVESLEPNGGRFGLGRIRGEADIRPEDWFLTCHFVDDRVMPGTLMYECCLHTLRIFLLRMGWVSHCESARCEPVPGVASGLKCRGQVTETTRRVTYEVSIKELGYGPEPYAIADALMYADGKPIVEIANLSLRIAGLTRADVEGAWRSAAAHTAVAIPPAPAVSPVPATTSAPAPVAPVPARSSGGDFDPTGTEPRSPLFDSASILAFATGKPSEAFGDRYRPFDSDRVIARLPGPPYMFLDRIVSIRDCAPWVLAPGGVIEAQYDVPPDAWYFAAERQPTMPFAVLLEVALQPCGWLAAYLGSALTSPTDLSFRNLGGAAIQFRPVGPDVGTLTTRVTSTRISSSGGMIIQNYDLEVRCPAGPVYRGDTYFGFFSKQALAHQVGLRDAARHQPDAAESARGRSFGYPTEAPFPDDRLRMIDTVAAFVPDGGPRGLGFVRGVKRVQPEEWFFKAHFHQDPVTPGSLGLESMLQLLKLAAVRRWGADGAHFEVMATGVRHAWTYRGQVVPADREVTVDAIVTAVDEATRTLTGDGFLVVDGRVIYEMKGFALRQRR